MGNKLGPALVIAIGIFLVYLTLTGKFQNLIAAANGTSGSGSGSGSGTAPASTPGVPAQSSTGSYASDTTPATNATTASTAGGLISGTPGSLLAGIGFGALTNSANTNGVVATTANGSPNTASYLPEIDSDGDLNLAAIDWNQLLASEQQAGLASQSLLGGTDMSDVANGGNIAGTPAGTLAMATGFTHT